MKRSFTRILLLAVFSLAVSANIQAQIVTLYAGSAAGTGGYIGDGSPLTSYELSNMRGLAWDHSGNMYICDAGNNRIRKITGTTITTIAGNGTAGFGGDGGPATGATCEINGPMEIVVDAAGTVYFTDMTNNRVRKISPAGVISTVAGNGTAGYGGDGGLATGATCELNQPAGLVIDKKGNLFVADQFNHRVRKITPAGIISTVVGNGTGGYTGDGGSAATCEISYPFYMRFDMWGNLYLEDRENGTIRVVDHSTGIINSVIGTLPAGFTGDGGAADVATYSYLPGDFHFDGAGNLYLADRTNWNIRMVAATNGYITGSSIISSIAGTNISGFSGDGGPALSATFKALEDALPDTNGNYYISDAGNNVIRRVGIDNQRPSFVNGTFQTLSVCENSVLNSINSLLPVHDTDHSGTLTWNVFSGPSHGVASAHYATTEFAGGSPYTPTGLYYSPSPHFSGQDTFVVWVNDGHSMDTTEIVVTVKSFYAGEITPEPATVCPGNTITLSSDTSGGSWSSANPLIASVAGAGVVTGVAAGNVLISYSITNSCGTASSVAMVTVGDATINTIAGDGIPSSGGDGSAATSAQIDYPTHTAMDASGNLYFGDYANNRIRKVNTSGIMSTVAGNGSTIYAGDGSGALATGISGTAGIAVDGAGNIYYSDYGNSAIRKISTSGIVTTVTGNGTTGFSGDGGPATSAVINVAWGLAFDGAGNLYFADRYNSRIRKISTSGIITTVAGTGTTGYTGDGGPATAAEIGTPIDVTVDASGNIYFATWTDYRVRKVDYNGIITSVAGNGTSGYTGDNIAATTSEINNPIGIGVDAAGNIFIGDYGNNRIREVNTSGTITTIAGTGVAGYNGDDIAATSAQLKSPYGVSVYGQGNIYICDAMNYRIREITAVAPTPVAAITGPSTVCVGSTIPLGETTTGGTWSSSIPAVGTVDPVTGIVTGISSGVTTITYSVIYTCGTLSASYPVTVNAAVAAISPASATICIGSAVTFTDGTSGGTWTMTNANATNVAGVVTGVIVGLDTVKYTLSGCSATAPVTVVASPAAISPANTTVCSGQTVTLTDATGSGVWSASNAHGTVAGGIVTGVSAGIDTISYSLGTCSSKAYVTVNASPAAISPASATICVGSTVSLTDATGSGTWSAQNGDATVVGGLVTGISAGVDNISYSIGSCYSISAITIVTAPAALSPSSASVCVGGTVTFTDATGGGVWSMSSPLFASVSGGVVTGTAVGIDSVMYSIGSCFVKAPVTVNAVPAAITPGTPVSVCVGSTTTLGDGTPGGTWSSSSPVIATVGTGGVVTGINPGVVTISYTSGAGCAATKLVTVLATPALISPATTSVCVGNTVVLSDATGGGVWSETTGNTTVAGGVVTGVTAGTDIISYTIGTCYSTATVTINALPAAISPAGPVTICVGGTATFTDGTPGGTWSSSAAGTATIAGGLVTGISAGTVTISYSNALGCAATEQMTVSVTPTAITPATSLVCVGNNVTLTDPVGGGVWSSVAPGIASVAGGVVTGVAVGSTTINYSIGTCTASATVTVSTAPVAGTVSGPSNVCVGGNITLTDPAGGGTWSSAEPGIGAVSGAGVVTGVSGGVATISYTVSNGCGSVAATHTVNVVPAGVLPITGLATICAGTFTNMTDATSGGTWSVSNATAAITGGGLLTGITPGTDTITYTVVNVCGTSSTTKSIVVGAFLSAGAITGGSSVCAGSSITLADLAPSGIWGATNGNATVAGGVVTGVTAGVDTITYTVTSSCGSAVATHNVTINPIPTGGTITGPANVCIGNLIPYTDATTGGVWSMTNAHATISLSGVVSPVSVGADTIVYTVTTACGTATANKIITIGAFLTAGTISGPTMVCTGTPVTLTDAATGGVWSASNGHATISGTGVVTGVTAGIDTISYTVTGSCGTLSAVQLMTVNLAPAAGSITGAATICLGTPSTYTDASPGGVWSISNAHATITGAGVVTPVSIGADTVIYTVTNVCGSAAATKPITVGGTVSAGTITGPLNVCIGSAITLADATTGGVWSASNSHATVGGGTVTGISSGADTISYTVTTACGSAAATAIVTVSPIPSGGTIVGPSSMCMGSFTIYTDASGGGVWSISNANATITGGGLVTALALGIDTITYTVTNGCGTAFTTKPIIIGAALTAGTISGPNAVCTGSNITMTDATGGGVWSSVNGNATVGSTGIVTGVAAGTDSIIYTVTSTCGSVAATYGITVYSVTPTGTITGPSAVCFGSSISESDVVAGGTWSAINGNATVSGTGNVNGITPGLDTIIYTVTGVCGAASAIKPIEIDGTAVAAPITGLAAVCAGSGITLMDATPGGAWSSSNGNAMVTGPGIIEGITTGADTILYLVTNACGTATVFKILTVNPAPVVAAISGPTTQCTGTTITLSDPTTGGVWTSSTPSVATIGLSSGVVTGITAGISTLTYTITNIFGCPGTVTSQDTVTMISGVPAITGVGNVCVGSSVTLSNTDPGGTWTSASPGIATAGSATGVVTGVSAGTVNITYTLATSCGTAFVTASETVNPLPAISAISGTASECVGSTATLTDGTAGGAWSSANPSVATVGTSTGIVTGVAAGTTTINYTVTSIPGCTASVSVMNTVNVTPLVSSITGTTNECIGGTSTLTDATGGGTWSSSNPAVASISGGGLVAGIATGVVTISYGVASGGCTGYAVISDTVNAIPVPSPITGSTNICIGSTSTLADAGFGGTWSSGTPSVATISSTGVVTGVSTGTDKIYYAIANSCGSVTDSVAISVSATASAGTISGSSVVCQGATITLSDGTGGGSWSATNAHATVGTSSGLVSGVSAGIDTIKYTVTNTCGTATATKVISVSSAPYPGSISGYSSLCAGTSISLSESVTGGAWSSSNSSVASVSGGVVSGIATGSATISYSVTNSCGTRSATHAVTVEPAGTCNTMVTNTNNSGEIKVYPNPATTLLQIEAPEAVNITVLSVDGKMVISLKDVTSVDISKLANGMYFINVFDNTGLLLKTAKFVKAE